MPIFFEYAINVFTGRIGRIVGAIRAPTISTRIAYVGRNHLLFAPTVNFSNRTAPGANTIGYTGAT